MRSGLTSRDEFGLAGERQRAEQSLREAEEHFRHAVGRGEEAQQQHVAYLDEIIAAQTELAQEELDDQRLMDRVVARLRELTGADGAVVELIDGSEMVYAAGSGSAAAHIGFRLQAEGSFSGLCTRTGEVLLSRDIETDPRVDRDATRKIKVRSMVVAPLAYGGRVVGVLKVMSAQPNGFDQQQVATLELLAGVLGGALGHAQAYAERSRAEADARVWSRK